MAITLKSDAEIAIMKKANEIVALTLDAVEAAVHAGVTTAELDAVCEKTIRSYGATPSFKGYRGFPASLCASVNEAVVHGIPSKKCRLKDGDIISIDVGTCYDGFYGDAARTIGVGKVSAEAKRLMDATRECLELAVAECHPGRRLGDVAAAIEERATAGKYGIVTDYVGHGIGRSAHEDPQVMNRGKRGTGLVLQAGLVIAIEPMLNLGSGAVRTLKDGWTVVTKDRKLSAHFEHSVAITEEGPYVLSVHQEE